jgi:hypothetical protein
LFRSGISGRDDGGFLEGHVRAFQYFGAVPTRILCDNTTLAVARILGDGERQKTRAVSELQSHYLFAEKFGRPGKGSDKGKVENLVGYARRNFMVPIPRASTWEELNAHLEADCRECRERRLRGHTKTIGKRFQCDCVAMLPLPAAPFEPCEKVTARVSSLAWYAIEPMNTRFPRPTAIDRYWSRATRTAWRSSAAAR